MKNRHDAKRATSIPDENTGGIFILNREYRETFYGVFKFILLRNDESRRPKKGLPRLIHYLQKRQSASPCQGGALMRGALVP